MRTRCQRREGGVIDDACLGGACKCGRGTMCLRMPLVPRSSCCDCRRHHRCHRHRCHHGGTSVGVCTAMHAELWQCASGAEPRVVASGAGPGAEPSAEPGAKPRARARASRTVFSGSMFRAQVIFKLVTDKHISYQNRHQKPLRACAASNHSIKISLSFGF